MMRYRTRGCSRMGLVSIALPTPFNATVRMRFLFECVMETSFRIPLFYAQSRKSTAYAFHVHHREKQTTALLMPRRRCSIDQIPPILQPDDFAESAIEHIGTQCNPYLAFRPSIVRQMCCLM